MTKLEYLDQLRSCLGQLPPEEAEKAAIYYGELIDDMTEDGYTEQEAVQALAPPAQPLQGLAGKFHMDAHRAGVILAAEHAEPPLSGAFAPLVGKEKNRRAAIRSGP